MVSFIKQEETRITILRVLKINRVMTTPIEQNDSSPSHIEDEKL